MNGMNEAEVEGPRHADGGCGSCAGLGDDSCNVGLSQSNEPAGGGVLPSWWRQRRWQLLMVCYLLLASGLALEFLLRRDALAVLAYAGSVVAGAYPSARDAWDAIRTVRLSIAALVVVSAGGAVLLGLWEEAPALVAVYSLGGILEARVVDRARRAIRKVRDLAPRTALVVRDTGDAEVPVETVGVGDIIRVRPGERVPLDGSVVEGHGAIDESPVSGEALPVDKGPGSAVLSGTLNQCGSLVVRVTSRAEDSTIAGVIRAVEEARRNKSSFETFGERFGAVYTPAMFVLALVVAGVPILLGFPWATWFYRALVVLVISCSCGLLLSVPVATLTAVTTGARHGLVVKGGAHLEAASQVDLVVLDKTGTLTLGRPEVASVVGLGGHSSEEALELAAAVETGSEHPLAMAVRDLAQKRGIRVAPSVDVEALPGRGARGTVEGRRINVGGLRWALEEGVDLGEPGATPGRGGTGTQLVVWDTSGPIGVISVEDVLRPEAKAAFGNLRAMGIQRLVMMTGDSRVAADAIAQDLGRIDVMAGLLPAEKAAQIRKLQANGHRVAFVGDGINDALALAQADLGIAMGLRGTDIARATCDVVLVDDDLRRLPEVFSLSRGAMRIMTENVALSVLIVAGLVVLALVGLVGLVSAIALNEGSALAVTANGLRLGRLRLSPMPPGRARAPVGSVGIAPP